MGGRGHRWGSGWGRREGWGRGLDARWLDNESSERGEALLAQGAAVSGCYTVARCLWRITGGTCSGRRTISHRARACGDLGGERILGRTPSEIPFCRGNEGNIWGNHYVCSSC